MGMTLIVGSTGLIGSETSMFLAERGFEVVGINNDMRRVFIFIATYEVYGDTPSRLPLLIEEILREKV
jgi:nucleoside-diphosphate-sugar epimerase